MKNFTKILACVIVGLLFSVSGYAQVSATSTASATIVSPIAISNTTPMNFGNVASGASLGTVVLASNGSRTTTGGVTLPPTTGSPTAALFTVTGQSTYTYSITIPIATSVTTISDGTNTMTVDNWTSSAATGTIASGTSTFTVGATLHVAATQAAGDYNTGNAGGSGPFTVTVNYN